MHRLTCLVPTHRRPAFLRRLLRFHQGCSEPVSLVVVDSSDDAAATENARAIATAKSAGLEVEHRRIGLDFIGKLRVALEEVRTPYVALCADDDVLFPGAMFRCADFLDTHPGHVSAQGRTALLYPHRRHFACMRLKGYDIGDDDPFTRCRKLADSFFSNFYAVYRPAELAENFRITAAHSDARLGYVQPEMLLSQLSALRGRIKVLPAMYLLMERHGTNAGFLGRSGERPDAATVYARFRECLVTEFERAGIDPARAGAYVDETFGYFRETSLRHRARRRPPGERLRRMLQAARERIEDAVHCDQARHRRLIRHGDHADAGPDWDRAVGLMRQFPDGIPD